MPSDEQLLSEGLEFLEALEKRLASEVAFLKPHNTSKLFQLDNLRGHLERVRARLTGQKPEVKPPRFEGTAPLLLAEAPRVNDPGSDVSAPTMTVGAMEDLFGPPIAPEVEGRPHTFDDQRLPAWCSHAILSHEKEERGRLLTFKFRGEEQMRVCWVRA